MREITRHFRGARARLTSRVAASRVARVLLVVATAATAAACSDFLDPEPNDVLAPETFYRTSADAIAAANGLYEQAKWGHWISYWYMSDIATDDVIASPNFGSDGHRFSNYEFDRSEGTLWGVWGDMYTVINRANTVLDRVPGITMDTTLRSRILGEAYFMRALSYFDLVRFWGDVPLIDHEVKSIDQVRIARTPAAQVWALIESDLQEATTRLWEKSTTGDAGRLTYSADDVGRPTSGAALGLLAKVYLTQGKWNQAAEAAGRVITNYRYELLPVWRDNFRISDEVVNKESMFELNYDATLDVGSVHNLFSLPQGYPGGDAYGLMHVPPSLVALYSTATGSVDVRGNHGTFMVPPYTDALGRTTDWSMPDGPAYAKYLDETNEQNMNRRAWAQQPNNWVKLRYADVLLVYAEAVAEGGTATAGTALSRLNQVRQRAGIGAINVSGTALRDSIRLERRRELVFEGHRWFDLARWNILDATIRTKLAEVITIYPTDPDGVHGVPSNLFPIPQGEIDVNPLLTQNPGWEDEPSSIRASRGRRD